MEPVGDNDDTVNVYFQPPVISFAKNINLTIGKEDLLCCVAISIIFPPLPRQEQQRAAGHNFFGRENPHRKGESSLLISLAPLQTTPVREVSARYLSSPGEGLRMKPRCTWWAWKKLRFSAAPFWP